MKQGVSARQLRMLDRQAVEEYGIPVILLMEHAGLAVAEAVRQRARGLEARIVCIAGRGHNGGDGLAAMRLLHTQGFHPDVFLLGRCAELRDEPALYARMLERLGVPLHELVTDVAWEAARQSLARADWIVDALLGTGASGPLQSDAERAIRLMNDAGRPILAVDTPSGLDVDTGTVSSVAVRATVTVTFGLPKQGFFSGEGPRQVGELVVDSITFPPVLLAQTQMTSCPPSPSP